MSNAPTTIHHTTTSMNLLIKFPTRNRSQKFLRVYNQYKDLASNPSTKIVAVIDPDDRMTKIACVNNDIDHITTTGKGKINAINTPLRLCDTYDILLLASDDMIPHVKGYDQIIIDKMRELYPDTDGVLWFNDGYTGSRLNTLVCAGRKYLDRFGYIYHPDYKSLWCDNEFMEIAQGIGKMTYIDQVIISHNHPMNIGSNMDELYRVNEAYYRQDEQTFKKRKEQGFPISSIYVTA